MSRSEREKAQLRQHIAHLEVMREEYNLLLNILISENKGEYYVTQEQAKKVVPVRPVRAIHRMANDSEKVRGINGKLIHFTLCDPEPEKAIIPVSGR